MRGKYLVSRMYTIIPFPELTLKVANSSQSPITSTWTAKEVEQAQALWNREDANKRSSDLTYQFGKVVKEKVSSPTAAA